jgi:hypothetical protein
MVDTSLDFFLDRFVVKLQCDQRSKYIFALMTFSFIKCAKTILFRFLMCYSLSNVQPAVKLVPLLILQNQSPSMSILK